MGCEHCEDGNFALIYDVDDGDCYIELFNDDGYICLRRSYENKTKSEYLPFNYCPTCGEKLGDA